MKQCLQRSAPVSLAVQAHLPRCPVHRHAAPTPSPSRTSRRSLRPSVEARGFLDGLRKTIGVGVGGGGNDAYEMPSAQGLDYYDDDEVEHYFNCMGFQAAEGSYDRMDLLKSMHSPAHVILLLACEENDQPKVEELLAAGASLDIKDNNGKTPMEIATKPEILAVMKEYQAKRAAGALA